MQFFFTTGPIYKGSAAVTAESEVSSGPESPKKRTSKLLPSFKIPAFKRNKGIRLVVLRLQLYVFLFLQTSLKKCVLVCLLFSTVLFLDLLVRPNKAEVLQLDGGGVLLVWKPVQSSDPVTYCVQYCTEGGLTEMIQQS